MIRNRMTPVAAFLWVGWMLTASGWESAHSQQTQASDQIQEIIVTGSRIIGPNATSASPTQVVTAKEIRQGGKIDIIDLINQLPQNFQSVAADFSNTSSGLTTPGGITTADLRGLGPQRTLVLINGRRWNRRPQHRQSQFRT